MELLSTGVAGLFIYFALAAALSASKLVCTRVGISDYNKMSVLTFALNFEHHR